jgi:hypothetical protein
MRTPIVKYIAYLLFLIPLYSLAASPAKLISAGPNADAPEQLMEYGQLVGTWQCKSFGLQQDGSWKEAEGVNTWTWHYVLNGHAIQDVWQPQPNAEGEVLPGTNLRTYDAVTGIWNVVWTIVSSPRIESFISSYRNDAIHITTEREATARFPAHMMHITFHNISEKHFDWKYESSALTDGQNWRELSRLSCDRDTQLADAPK